jgi:hypothetical protein
MALGIVVASMIEPLREWMNDVPSVATESGLAICQRLQGAGIFAAHM